MHAVHGLVRDEGSEDLAIVHISFRSSSTAPAATFRLQSFSAAKKHRQLLLLESRNLPDFAQGDALLFWRAADSQERVNGRVYTELQIALPRELKRDQLENLAKTFVHELLGERFAYTLALHAFAPEKGEQEGTKPMLHLLFSERVIAEKTRGLDPRLFFRRNGAIKDHSWNKRTKPVEVRQLWVKLANHAFEQAHLPLRLDPRSWAEQGRFDLAALREPKLLVGKGLPTTEARAAVKTLRRQRARLPSTQLNQESALELLLREEERAIREIEEKRDRQLAAIDQEAKHSKQSPGRVSGADLSR